MWQRTEAVEKEQLKTETEEKMGVVVAVVLILT